MVIQASAGLASVRNANKVGLMFDMLQLVDRERISNSLKQADKLTHVGQQDR
jgi:hypothetical protein